MTESPPPPPNLKLKISLPDKVETPAISANYFNVAWVGSDIELWIGFTDLVQFIQKRDAAVQAGAGEVNVTPEIAVRIVMSPASFEALQGQMSIVAAGMESARATSTTAAK